MQWNSILRHECQLDVRLFLMYLSTIYEKYNFPNVLHIMYFIVYRNLKIIKLSVLFSTKRNYVYQI